MKYARAKELIEKYFDDALSPEEREQLLHLTEDTGNDELVTLLNEMLANESGGSVHIDEERRSLSLMKILAADRPVIPRMLPFRTVWLRYAAAVILIAVTGLYAWLQRTDRDQPGAGNVATAQPAGDIRPGGNKATLTLSDGMVIPLDSAANGQLATQQGSRILNQNGQIIYTPAVNAQNVLAYNTLRTPRGGVYQLNLPDGTKVWLNAASSIRYPVVFSGKERLVEITGEAYFEVAQHAQMPFKVKINENNLIEVLGTQFNVKAYTEDGLINTTLLQGAVRVASNGKKITLGPGQQAQADSRALLVKTPGQAGIAQVMAWKDGRFNFQDASLQEIMRQLARWYDIEVVYEKGIPDLEFIGEVERSLPLSEVLKGLRMSGVHFRLEGKRLIISPL